MKALRFEGRRADGATDWILLDHLERVWTRWGWYLKRRVSDYGGRSAELR